MLLDSMRLQMSNFFALADKSLELNSETLRYVGLVRKEYEAYSKRFESTHEELLSLDKAIDKQFKLITDLSNRRLLIREEVQKDLERFREFHLDMCNQAIKNGLHVQTILEKISDEAYNAGNE